MSEKRRKKKKKKKEEKATTVEGGSELKKNRTTEKTRWGGKSNNRSQEGNDVAGRGDLLNELGEHALFLPLFLQKFLLLLQCLLSENPLG